jgi:hypothetical protein
MWPAASVSGIYAGRKGGEYGGRGTAVVAEIGVLRSRLGPPSNFREPLADKSPLWRQRHAKSPRLKGRSIRAGSRGRLPFQMMQQHLLTFEQQWTDTSFRRR